MKFEAGRHKFHISMQSAALLTAVLALASSAAGACAQGAGYWHTSGSQILDARGNAVRIAGISWFGFETSDQVVHGLGDQDYQQILYTIKATGFNTIRLPFSNQMVENPIVPPFDKTPGAVNGELSGLNSLEIMDKIIAAAGDEGLKVILDDHRSEAGNSNESNGLWYTRAYPDSSWIADWEMLVRRYKDFTDAHGNPIVIGVDLRNEPYTMVNGEPIGSCWTGDTTTRGCPVTDTEHNWPQAAGRAAQAVLGINPNLLIFVEGLDCYSGSCNWQGGNLEGAGVYPVELPFSGHLAYSAHDYGPDVSPQPWFGKDTTTALMEHGWIKHWAFLSAGNIAPVWLGEFGTSNNEKDIQSNEPGSQGQWFSALVNFLRSQPRIGWAYWAVNGEDRTGLLTGTYSAPPPHSLKMEQLASIQLAQNTLAGNQPQSAGLEVQEAILRAIKPQTVSGIAASVALSLVFFALVVSKRRKPRGKQPLGGEPSVPVAESNPPTLPSLRS